MNNEDFQIIKRNDFAVIINGEKILTPEFTRIATSRYRLTPELILQKQCPKCKQWYDVAKYENEQWVEIWLESEYKKSKTGSFPTYCTQCNNQLRELQQFDKDNKSADNLNRKYFKKDTVIWDSDVYKYVMIQAVLEGKSKNQYLNDTFRDLMKKKPIKIPLENKSE